mmetsp:Transcript_31837/g.93090  ORF Transcript_31837/g.93090 Transcript_31837/m.93090 type:complete len:383 (-) Transcript_31837:362-1510(-)
MVGRAVDGSRSESLCSQQPDRGSPPHEHHHPVPLLPRRRSLFDDQLPGRRTHNLHQLGEHFVRRAIRIDAPGLNRILGERHLQGHDGAGAPFTFQLREHHLMDFRGCRLGQHDRRSAVDGVARLHSERPRGIHVVAIADECPSICGHSGHRGGDDGVCADIRRVSAHLLHDPLLHLLEVAAALGGCYKDNLCHGERLIPLHDCDDPDLLGFCDRGDDDLRSPPPGLVDDPGRLVDVLQDRYGERVQVGQHVRPGLLDIGAVGVDVRAPRRPFVVKHGSGHHYGHLSAGAQRGGQHDDDSRPLGIHLECLPPSEDVDIVPCAVQQSVQHAPDDIDPGVAPGFSEHAGLPGRVSCQGVLQQSEADRSCWSGPFGDRADGRRNSC